MLFTSHTLEGGVNIQTKENANISNADFHGHHLLHLYPHFYWMLSCVGKVSLIWHMDSIQRSG